jgi:hypothetical protein
MAKLVYLLALAAIAFSTRDACYKHHNGVVPTYHEDPYPLLPLEAYPANLSWHNVNDTDFLTIAKN